MLSAIYIFIGFGFDGIANLFWWGIKVFPLTPLIKYRRKKIMEGIEITHAEFEVKGDTYPDINIHIHIESRTIANLRIKSFTLCLRSGQWEIGRIYATPVMDELPTVVKGRQTTEFNLRFDAPLKWWLECPSNMNISKAVLEGTTSWGDLNWAVKIGHCSMNIEGIDGVRNQYLSRIGLGRGDDGL